MKGQKETLFARSFLILASLPLAILLFLTWGIVLGTSNLLMGAVAWTWMFMMMAFTAQHDR